MGYRLGDCMEDPDIAALYVFNAVFGGCVNVKFFVNVREKALAVLLRKLACRSAQGAYDRLIRR